MMSIGEITGIIVFLFTVGAAFVKQMMDKAKLEQTVYFYREAAQVAEATLRRDMLKIETDIKAEIEKMSKNQIELERDIDDSLKELNKNIQELSLKIGEFKK